ncbi:hypothetical protein BJY04DRAFT_140220 [Aspergillus karnatakaensis]|uniref:uncharacterized protein n=1 Tax=Aspergillus karnatakaensis TaxID=1810916 RepID=UPI003CCDB777
MIHTDLRDPINFNMYVFNDFAGYGVLEVLQNLLVDFDEAIGNWKERWAICEALPFYWKTEACMPLTMIDDGDAVAATFGILSHMFVAMLAELETKSLLKPESEVKNLGFVMALYMELADDLREYNCLNEEPTKGFNPAQIDAYVLAYAKKYHIKLHGPSKMNSLRTLRQHMMRKMKRTELSSRPKVSIPGSGLALQKSTQENMARSLAGAPCERKEWEATTWISRLGPVPSVRSMHLTRKTHSVKSSWTISESA